MLLVFPRFGTGCIVLLWVVTGLFCYVFVVIGQSDLSDVLIAFCCFLCRPNKILDSCSEARHHFLQTLYQI